METRENPTNQDSTYVLQGFFIFVPESKKDPTVNTHILVVGFRNLQRKIASSATNVYLSQLAAQTRRLIFRKS